MKQQKIVINYSGSEFGSITVNDRAEAARKVRHLLADYTHIEITNVSLSIERTEESISAMRRSIMETFVCEECRFTRHPHEHRCLDKENCKCQHCVDVRNYANKISKK